MPAETTTLTQREFALCAFSILVFHEPGERLRLSVLCPGNSVTDDYSIHLPFFFLFNFCLVSFVVRGLMYYGRIYHRIPHPSRAERPRTHHQTYPDREMALSNHLSGVSPGKADSGRLNNPARRIALHLERKPAVVRMVCLIMSVVR